MSLSREQKAELSEDTQKLLEAGMLSSDLSPSETGIRSLARILFEDKEMRVKLVEKAEIYIEKQGIQEDIY